MSKTPFMPLWVSDFVGDTLDLDAKEIGAYMLLLMAMWQRGGHLPNDPEKLRRVARCGRDWPRIWAAIERFFEVDGDQITNARLRHEFTAVAAKREVNAQNGARGGRAKALKTKDQGVANATGSLKQPEPYPERVDPDGSTPPVSPTLSGDEIEAASKPERPPPKMFLPSGWVLDDDGWTYARQHNLLDHEIQEIADGFRGYWTERRDKDAKRTEDGWRRTWQGHIRRSAPEYARSRRATGPSQAGGHRQPASIASIAARRRAERQDQDDLPERWRIA